MGALADLVGSFEAWSSQSPLESMNVTVYEGVQESGSVLYIPAGAPHAAQALSNHSLMVATNTYTLEDFEIIHSICSNEETQFAAQFGAGAENLLSCDKFTKSHPYNTMLRNKKEFGSRVERKDTPFLEVF